MADPVTINLRHVARGLGIPLRQVEAVVELLDEGNTVPFVTRYRKDQTGGLDEEQVRQVQTRLTKMRLLAERKQTILRSIEAQGKLSERLAKQILAAGTTKRLEDLYLPYKPKKQTLATTARARGLEVLAQEILSAAVGAADLDRRAADFANPDRQVPSAADALLGAGHILAEEFSEHAELRQRLREILQRTGKVVCGQVAPEGKIAAEKAERVEKAEKPPHAQPAGAEPPASSRPAIPWTETAVGLAGLPETLLAEPGPPSEAPAETAAPPAAGMGEPLAPEGEDVSEVPGMTVAPTVPESLAPFVVDTGLADTVIVEGGALASPGTGVDASAAAAPPARAAAPSARPTLKQVRAEQKRDKKEQKKKREEQRRQKAFSDYYSYSEEIKRIPPHRVLAINRGERARVLRVRIECDVEAMHKALDELCVPAEHPHAEFLRGCARDALARLILPSLEREVRRELTDRAEAHAVTVFARNLRNLLLQPPVRDRRVLAVDPGFKSGCKLAAMDQFGSVLAHEVVYLIGKPERREEARRKVIELVEQHQLTVVVVGNGTGCRETESFFAELISNELKEKGVSYVIVNEAGASVYSTSHVGREEFPAYDASLRGAISIGRRLQDPLSELVKIDPASIGVGLYQHDVKAKHLRDSLDGVVESCVNYVGVDVNTASPTLLRYVSGLNQLTARRVYEHRLANGPFRSRQQLKDVAGFGEATFIQAAGFLKIVAGDNPLDATWIHPESYDIAARVLAKLGCTTGDLAAPGGGALAERTVQVDAAALAAELQVGTMLLKDIMAQLARPGRDPREDLPPPIFKQGVLKLEDLTPGMELTGTVLNVVDFGAFVDIGMHDSGLVHVSQIADRFVRDPHEVVAVGDVVKVWVLEVDKQRRRVSLTMIPPGRERQSGHRHGSPPAHGRPSQGRPDDRGRPPARPRPEGQATTAAQPPGQDGGGPPPRRTDRPPRREGQPGGRPGGRPPGKGPPRQEDRGQARPPRPRPPKFITPLSDEMKAGKAPMRSFSDLVQFYDLQQDGSSGSKDQGRKGRDPRPRGKSDRPPAADPGRSAPPPQAAEPAPSASEPSLPPPDAPPRADSPATSDHPLVPECQPPETPPCPAAPADPPEPEAPDRPSAAAEEPAPPAEEPSPPVVGPETAGGDSPAT